MKPIVSIIIPTYNRAHLIKETLESVLAQTYSKWECIIVDDGSIDSTAELIAEYFKKDARFIYLTRPAYKTKGPSSCRNIGIENSNGEYIVFLDSDDLLAKTCLENRVNFVDKHRNFDFWIFNSQIIYIKNNIKKKFNKILSEYSDEEYLNTFFNSIMAYQTTAPLWKKQTLLILGGFDENLMFLEDPDLSIRAFLYGFKSKSCVDCECDYYYLFENDSIQSREKTILILENHIYLFNKYKKIYNKLLHLYLLNGLKISLKFSLKYSLKFYLIMMMNKLLNKRELFMVPILIFYKSLNLENLKGIGYYKLYSFTFKS